MLPLGNMVWHLCVRCSVTNGEQSRVLFAKSAEEHMEWLEVLKRASKVVPFEDVYHLGVSAFFHYNFVFWRCDGFCGTSVCALVEFFGRSLTQSLCSLLRIVRTVFTPTFVRHPLQREIGSGRFSKVYEGTHRVTGLTVAVKVITKADLKEV